MKLTGKLVDLIPIETRHIDALNFAASIDRSSYGFTQVPDSKAMMAEYVNEAVKQLNEKRAVPFVVFDKKNLRIVGSTRFAHFEYWDWPVSSSLYRRESDVPDAVEIGWTWLAADVQRTGINTEMKLLMLTQAFEVWRVLRVTLKTDSRNLRSQKAIERIGGKYDGTLRAHMRAVDGGIRHTAFYSILLEEWPAVKAKLASKMVNG